MSMARAIILLLDSFGIGHAADAERFGDKGADTLGHICSWMAENRKNEDGSPRFLYLPNMARLGLEKAAEISRGQRLAHTIAGESIEITGAYTYAQEVSRGKDTLSGHWEMMGVPVDFEWGYFPDKLLSAGIGGSNYKRRKFAGSFRRKTCFRHGNY